MEIVESAIFDTRVNVFVAVGGGGADNPGMDFPETIVAAATAPVESALALVRLSGAACERLVAAALGRGRPPPLRKAVAGVWHDVSGAPLDECVVVLYGAGASFTGEAALEITCHGNPLIVRKLLRDCVARGCRLAGPGEFTRRAFLNGRLDLSQAEAVAGVISAKSEQALASARRLLAGELGKKVAAWSGQLLQVLAGLEAYIDFPDEDLPPETAGGPLAALRDLAAEFAKTAGTSRFDASMREGVKLVLAGAPNAGKSSLLNALLGEDRALVCAEPGTTRDFIREQLQIGPYPCWAVDTAGLREFGRRDIEALGIARAREQIASADFTLVVVDGSAPPPQLPPGVLAGLAPERALLALNKSDLPADPATAAFLPALPRVALSAKDGTGLAALRAALAAAFERHGIVPADGAMVVNERHAAALRAAIKHLAAAAALSRTAAPAELAAAEVRAALEALGEITGREAVENERMLDRLFATFCIGK